LVIVAESTGINITGGCMRVFEIAAGSVAEFVDILMIAGTSMNGGAINNTGTLKLKNVVFEPSPASMGASLIHNMPGAQLFVSGNCELNQ